MRPVIPSLAVAMSVIALTCCVSETRPPSRTLTLDYAWKSLLEAKDLGEGAALADQPLGESSGILTYWLSGMDNEIYDVTAAGAIPTAARSFSIGKGRTLRELITIFPSESNARQAFRTSQDNRTGDRCRGEMDPGGEICRVLGSDASSYGVEVGLARKSSTRSWDVIYLAQRGNALLAVHAGGYDDTSAPGDIPRQTEKWWMKLLARAARAASTASRSPGIDLAWINARMLPATAFEPSVWRVPAMRYPCLDRTSEQAAQAGYPPFAFRRYGVAFDRRVEAGATDVVEAVASYPTGDAATSFLSAVRRTAPSACPAFDSDGYKELPANWHQALFTRAGWGTLRVIEHVSDPGKWQNTTVYDVAQKGTLVVLLSFYFIGAISDTALASHIDPITNEALERLESQV